MGISVLMCVCRKDDPHYFHEAMRSVWTDQTLKPDEIVLVQDGSVGEELGGVIGFWEHKLDKKLKLIINDKNMGLTKSLNKGLRVVSEEYIARMDADDISMPERFQRQVDYMQKHTDIAVVGGSIQEFNAANDCVNVRYYPEMNENVIKYICKASPCAHPATMIRREVFDKGIIYDENYRTSQDLALWYSILYAGLKINNMKEVVLKFRLADDIFNRRSRVYANNEFKIYCMGIRKLYGFFSWRYIYPLARLIFRLMPVHLIHRIYNSNIRQKILQTKINNL